MKNSCSLFPKIRGEGIILRLHMGLSRLASIDSEEFPYLRAPTMKNLDSVPRSKQALLPTLRRQRRYQARMMVSCSDLAEQELSSKTIETEVSKIVGMLGSGLFSFDVSNGDDFSGLVDSSFIRSIYNPK